MFEKLIDKIGYEDDKYFCYLKLISRTDFYTRAFEIAVKRAIYLSLKEDIEAGNLKTELDELLMQQECAIDYIYLKAGTEAVLWKERLTRDSWNLMKTKIKF